MCAHFFHTIHCTANEDIGDAIIDENSVYGDAAPATNSTDNIDVTDEADFMQAIVNNDFGPELNENIPTFSAVEGINSASGNYIFIPI